MSHQEKNQTAKIAFQMMGRRFTACLLSLLLAGWGIAPVATAAPAQDDSPAAAETFGQTSDSGATEQKEEDKTTSGDSGVAPTKKGDSDEGSKASKAKEDKKATKKSTKKSKKKSAKEEAKIASAKKAIERMNGLAAKLELAYEDLNEQQKELDALKKEIKKTKKSIKNADKSLKESKKKVTQYVRESYVNGKIRYLSVLLDATNFGDFVSHLMFLDILAENEQQTIDDMKRAKKELGKEKKKLEEQKAKQEELTKAAEDNAKVVESALLEQADYFAALPEKVRKKVLAYDGVKGSLSVSAGLAGSHSTRGSHPEVVTEALKYLGTPYVWGGETPSGFDCSGLVLYCYKKTTGKDLTHFARTQYSEGKRIAKSALMPGDLVFFGSNVATIHHVGIYMGNDKFIHAPHTGDVVKISTLSNRSDYVGACRP